MVFVVRSGQRVLAAGAQNLRQLPEPLTRSSEKPLRAAGSGRVTAPFWVVPNR